MKWKSMFVVMSVMLNVGLLAYLVMGPSHPTIFLSETYGQNRAVAGGGYAVTTANVTSSRQALWLVDNSEKRLIVYLVGSGKKRGLEPIAARDLRRDFGEDLAGDVLLVPGEISSGVEAVYVIDPVGKKLIGYFSRGKGLELVGLRNLGEDFRK
ncbi:MAG: hypothetical protein AMK75_06750 [Planctomycetes bacterium SM23_65]|nr:MAG: hypothetical protein AMK75_06750 [Planctomycetes bacterium SM23_65]